MGDTLQTIDTCYKDTMHGPLNLNISINGARCLLEYLDGALASIQEHPDSWGGQETVEVMANSLLQMRAICLELDPNEYGPESLRNKHTEGPLALCDRSHDDEAFMAVLRKVIRETLSAQDRAFFGHTACPL